MNLIHREHNDMILKRSLLFENLKSLLKTFHKAQWPRPGQPGQQKPWSWWSPRVIPGLMISGTVELQIFAIINFKGKPTQFVLDFFPKANQIVSIVFCRTKDHLAVRAIQLIQSSVQYVGVNSGNVTANLGKQFQSLLMIDETAN